MIEPAITAFYTNHSEDSRLQVGLGPLEFERNKSLISRYLQDDSLAVADVGGGTGHYAAWLCGMGHRVTLIDPVPKHIEQAKRKANRMGKGFTCLLGEARYLPFESEVFDLIILHGPLYHLQQEVERLQALKEAYRVLKPRGVVLGFAITHAASTVAALHSSMIHEPRVFPCAVRSCLTGNIFLRRAWPVCCRMHTFIAPVGLPTNLKRLDLHQWECTRLRAWPGWMASFSKAGRIPKNVRAFWN